VTPAVLINRVLDHANQPHIRHLHCPTLGRCFGTVGGVKTTWFVQRKSARLVCLCYLVHPPKPMPAPD
jgi:hypothetical protein